MTHVRDRMSEAPATCRMDDSVNRAAQLMWEHDCGCVPVVDDERRVVGMLTDRDVCMGAYTQGRPLASIPVASVCAKQVFACRPEDPIAKAEALMIEHQVRRLPVTDGEGRIVGVLSISDLTRGAGVPARDKAKTGKHEALSSVLGAVSRLRTVARAKVKREHEAEGDRRPVRS